MRPCCHPTSTSTARALRRPQRELTDRSACLGFSWGPTKCGWERRPGPWSRPGCGGTAALSLGATSGSNDETETQRNKELVQSHTDGKQRSIFHLIFTTASPTKNDLSPTYKAHCLNSSVSGSKLQKSNSTPYTLTCGSHSRASAERVGPGPTSCHQSLGLPRDLKDKDALYWNIIHCFPGVSGPKPHFWHS